MKKGLIIFFLVALVALVNVAAHLFFGANTHEPNPYFMWTMKVFNFVLLATILTVLLKTPASGFFSAKARELKENLAEAEKKLADANRKLAEAEEKLRNLDTELSLIKENSEAEGKKEERLLRKEAEDSARKIIEKAESEIKGKVSQAKKDLSYHISDLAVEIARKKLEAEMDDRKRKRFFDEALDDIKEKL